MKDAASEKPPSGPFFSNKLIIAIALAIGLLTALLDVMGDFTWKRFLLIFFFHSVIAFLAFFAILRLIRFVTDGFTSARDLREHLRKKSPDDFEKTSPDEIGPGGTDRPGEKPRTSGSTPREQKD